MVTSLDYDGSMNTKTTTTVTCPKCFGVGSFPRFSHIVAGTCFRCGGTGRSEETIRAAPALRAAPAFVPHAATPYAVVCTDATALADGAGGRIGGNDTWEQACGLLARLTATHGVAYAIIKYVDGRWISREGVEQNV